LIEVNHRCGHKTERQGGEDEPCEGMDGQVFILGLLSCCSGIVPERHCVRGGWEGFQMGGTGGL
jgi:hypothetical protein